MLNLIDGPAKGVYYCKRAPLFLRAIVGADGEKDCLDLIEDEPKPGEEVFVYVREGSAGMVHINGTKIHGFFASGNYKFMPDVEGDELRDNDAWQIWARSHSQ